METITFDYNLFVKKSIQKRIIKYQLAYEKIIELGEMAEMVYGEVGALLGEDDPITGYIYFAMSYIVDEAITSLGKVIEEGNPLKPIINPNVILKLMSPEA